MQNSHAILVGMIDAYREEVKPTDTVICINRAYVLQRQFSKVSAVYMLDDVDLFHADDIYKEVNDLNCMVYNRKTNSKFRSSFEYPLQEVIDYYNGLQYFSCTAAYALALCIKDGYEKITLHGMYHAQDSLEYIHHKPCIDFWCGMALGRGIDLHYNEDKMTVCRPMPWQPRLYSYQRNVNEGLCIQTIACAYRACMGYPMSFRDADDITKEDNERQKEMTQAMIGSV